MADNPVTYCQKITGVKSIDLARQVNVSRQYITRCKQGSIGKLSTKVTRWCAEVLSKEWGRDVNQGEVNSFYVAFQNKRRLEAYEFIGEPGLPGYESRNEFISWRKVYYPVSAYSFATAWCIHPDLVSSFEDGTVKEMPTIMREAFDYVRSTIS